ncbi:MAG: isocitrate lyase [Chloroflexi bacterium]|nr:isocitrate lyase [Chloroflexota bacterium]
MTEARELEARWKEDQRWKDITRTYSTQDVVKLRGTLKIEHTIAKHGAQRLWHLLRTEPYVNTFGALSGAQAVQMVQSGLKAIYVSGWQVAADANLAGPTYPDQSLYPANSVPTLVRRINNAFARADQIHALNGKNGIHWFAPIVADAEAGFGGPIHAFELTKAMIEAGASGVHFEDQLAAEKKCGHMGGKVLIPTSQFIRTMTAARLASDVLDVPTVLVARTDARDATLLVSDVDERDRQWVTGQRTPEGYHMIRNGMDLAIDRAIAYAPYADLLWFETSEPNLEEARRFEHTIHAKYPGKLLAYNCSPSFNWKRHLDDKAIARFQQELGAMGFAFQFITLAGWHLLNYHTFDLASAYKRDGMAAYSRLQEREFAMERDGYTATKHQAEVGTGYFDQVLMAVTNGTSSTLALAGSTEAEQFH